MKRPNRWFAGLAGTALALAISASVFAYAGEVAGAVSVSGPSTVACGAGLTVTATVVDASGKPIEGQPVFWSFNSSPSSSDRINDTTTTTDASGVATTTLTLASVAGSREVSATADAVIGSVVIGVACAALPRTSTAMDTSPIGNLPIAPMLALLAVFAGGGIILRRVALSPR